MLALINTATAQAVFALTVLGTYAAYAINHILKFFNWLEHTHFCTIGMG